MHKEFQVRVFVLERDVTVPKNPKIIQILPGETVWDAIPKYSVGVNDVDVVSQSQIFRTRVIVFIIWNDGAN